MNPEIRKFVLLNPGMLKAFGFRGLELAAYAFEIQAYQKGYVCIEAVKRDKNGHFFKDDGAPCPHRKGGRQKQSPKKEIKLPDGFKSIAVKNVYDRIGGTNGETITASDGNEARFSQIGINHFKRKTITERNQRLQSLDVAQDTVKTGEHFDSYIPNTNIPQTEFIKDYGNKFYYTARRKDTGEVYSWHELSPSQFKRKTGMLNEYKRTGEIQKYER